MLEAYYATQLHSNDSLIAPTYNFWRNVVGHDVCRYIDANKVGNVCTDIKKNKRLIDAEITQIKTHASHVR